MATLNTLRTRFGVVLSAVIAFALLAFIFSLKAEMGFSGNDPVVAEIDGQNVTYTEYQQEYNNIMRQSGVSEVDEQQANMLYQATWQALISKVVLEPGFEKMGLSICEAERLAMIRGEIPTQAFYSAFADPQTGMYNIGAVNNFLFTSQGNPEAEAMWATLVEQAEAERETMKYVGLINGGVNLNALEVAAGVDAANKNFAGRWASKRYTDVADSLVSVSKAEIKSYYDANKAAYKRLPTRTVSYVEFNVAPSKEDLAALEMKATELGDGFAQASDVRAFVRESRSGSISPNYVSAAGLPAGVSEAMVAGKQYGPESDGSKWTIARAEDSVYASDTLSVRHIVLSYTDAELADSLLVALRKGTDTDFATAASTYSLYSQSAQNGGDIGAVPFAAFTDEFADALAPAKSGQIVKVESGDMIQLIKIYKAGSRVKHYKLATIEVPIVASQATRTAAHNSAGLFAVAAKGGVDKFSAAATEATVSSHSADLTSATRNIAAVAGSSEVARWAHRAEVGQVSEIFKVDNGYLVAMLTGVNESEFRALNEVESTIRRKLTNEKKYELLRSQLSGSTFDEQVASLDAATGEFKDTNFASYYIAGLGVEPRVIGAITTTKSTGELSAPIEGNSALYIYIVDQIEESDEPQTAEAEKLRAVATQQQMFQQMLFSAIESLSKVKDLRGANL